MLDIDTKMFLNRIADLNRFKKNGFERWIFVPGMGFGDCEKWWGDFGLRPAPHEGIDVCLYRTSRGELCRIAPGALVPAMADGQIMACSPDFLGVSVFLRHDPCGPDSCVFSIYGHSVPLPGIAPGRRVHAGEAISTVAPVDPEKKALLPHLHLSIARIPTDIPTRDLSWKVCHGSERVEFLDPLPYCVR